MARADTEDTATGDVTRADREQQSWQDYLAQINEQYVPYYTSLPVDPSNGLRYEEKNGKKTYPEPPVTPEAYLERVKAGSFFKDTPHWDPTQGQYVADTNWGNVIGLGIAGTIGGFAVAGALGAGGAAALPESTGEFAGGTGAAGTAGVDAGTTALADVGTTAGAAGGAGGAGAGIAAPTTITGLTTPGVGTAATTVGVSAPVAGGASVAAPATITGLTTPGVGAPATSPAWTTAGSGLSGAPAAGTTGATAGNASLWTKVAGNPLVSQGVGAAASLYGAKLQADANKDAAAAQARTAREALDWEKSVYGQRQQQLAPTINIGNSARVQQASLMGLSPGTPSNGWNYVTPQTAPNAVANPTWTTQSPTAPPGMVSMYDPTGKMGYVPQKNVQAALNAGGRMA